MNEGALADAGLISRIRLAVQRNPAYALIAPAFAYLLWLTTSSQQWFFADEWEFITSRSRPPLSQIGQYVDVLLRPHNEHWSTIPILLYRGIFGLVGLKAYWPYLVLLLTLHCLLAVLLGRLLSRHGFSGWQILPVVAVFLLYGAGSENILWAFQMAWMLSLIFGLVLLELSTTQLTRNRMGLCWLIGVAALMCSGLGISMVAVGTFSALLRHGWRAAAKFVSVPAVIQIIWLLTHGSGGTRNHPIVWTRSVFETPGYVWKSLASTIDRTIGVEGLGSVVVVAVLAGVALWGPEIARVHGELVALAGGLLVFLTIVAYGRVGLGLPQSSRYSYVIYVMLVPLVAVLLRKVLAFLPSGRNWVVSVLGIVSFLFSWGTLVSDARTEGTNEIKIRGEVVAAFTVARSSFAASESAPSPESGELTIGWVRQLLAQGISPRGIPEPGPLAIVTARTSVDVTPEPRVPLNPANLTMAAMGRMTAEVVETDCIAFNPTGLLPQLAILPRRPASFKVVPLGDGKLLITVKRDGQAAPPLQIPVAANNPVFVNLADPRNEYILGFIDNAPTKACGLGRELPPQ